MNRLSLLRSAALHVSTGEGVRPHATQAWKLVVGVNCTLRVAFEGKVAHPRAVLVAPHAVQSMDRDGVAVACFAEPGSHGMPLSRGSKPILVPDARTTEALVRVASSLTRDDSRDDEAALDEAFALVAPEGDRRLDRRVERALREGALDLGATVEDLAARCRLSSTRLRHLVRAETGLSLRAHRLWHRTLLGVEAVMTGAGVGAAAYRAGFADHAHFTNAFRRFFGRTPTSMPESARILATWAERPQAACTLGGSR